MASLTTLAPSPAPRALRLSLVVRPSHSLSRDSLLPVPSSLPRSPCSPIASSSSSPLPLTSVVAVCSGFASLAFKPILLSMAPAAEGRLCISTAPGLRPSRRLLALIDPPNDPPNDPPTEPVRLCVLRLLLPQLLRFPRSTTALRDNASFAQAPCGENCLPSSDVPFGPLTPDAAAVLLLAPGVEASTAFFLDIASFAHAPAAEKPALPAEEPLVVRELTSPLDDKQELRLNSSTTSHAACISCSRRHFAFSMFLISCASFGFSSSTSGSAIIRRNVSARSTTTSTVVFAWMDAFRISAPNSERSPKNSPRFKRLTTIIRFSSITTDTAPSNTMYMAEAMDPLWHTHSCCGKTSITIVSMRAEMSRGPQLPNIGTVIKTAKHTWCMMSRRKVAFI
mmetsp:Transcript_9124/g.24273  ORF Transcript_9124/g.24273 Transcript_9124/m.24273 type:complete len:395 (-) Transcript_9124:3404-4588(-)